MERSYMLTPAGEISYLERAGEIPLVFLHGLGGAGNNGLKLAQYLPQKYRIILPDLLGHGRSSQKLLEYSIKEQVTAISFLLMELGIPTPILVGNSYGGWVSMRLCIAGMKVSALILIDSAGINPTVGESPDGRTEQFVDRVMTMNPRNDRDIIRNFVNMNATGREKVRKEELIQLPEKTLIIWGRNDRLIPLRYAEELHSSIRGSKLEVINDAGHTPHSTHSNVVARIISDFLGS